MDYKRGPVIVKNIKASYLVTYTGQGVSTNSFYAGGAGKNGWRTRAAIKTKYSKIFTSLLNDSDLEWMDEYMMVIFYNSKQDPDNVLGGLGKLVLDTLKQEREAGVVIKHGWVYDDSKQYLKGVMCFPDSALPTNTFDIQFIKLK